MSKFRVEREKMLYDSGPGPLRMQLIAYDKALSLFSVRERVAILKDCAQRMGDFWLAKWLPARFTGYARRALGYRSTPKYDKYKRNHFGEALPLVFNGTLQEATSFATAKGQGSGGNPAVLIRIPTGNHRLAAIVQQVLNTLPSAEVDEMAAEFGKRLAELVNNADSPKPNRSRLTATQRGLLGLKSRKQNRGNLAA